MAEGSIEVAAGIIVLDDRVLICRRHRKDVHHALKWEFPGGKLEAGEGADEALVRELQEELGIQVLELEEVARHEHHYRNGPHVQLYFFLVKEFLSTVKNNIYEEIRWVKSKELDQFDFLDGDKGIIEMIMKDEINIGGKCAACALKM